MYNASQAKPEKIVPPVVEDTPEGKKWETEMVESRAWWQEVVAEVLEKVGEKTGKSMLGAYSVRPGSKFITQQEDEEIVLLLRAHPITNIPWMLTVLAMLILPSIFMMTGAFAAVPGKFIFVAQLMWYLAILAFSMEKLLGWYYSIFIVTNERLVDIDYFNLMYRHVTYANLNHIEEPTMVMGGFVRSLFQYGDVLVTTASEVPTVEAKGVPHPDKVIDIISRLSEELEKRREQGK